MQILGASINQNPDAKKRGGIRAKREEQQGWLDFANHESGMAWYQDGSFEADAAATVQIDPFGTRPNGLRVARVVLAH